MNRQMPSAPKELPTFSQMTSIVCRIVVLTQERPDQVSPHRSRPDRMVFRKKFSIQVVVNGKTRKACYSVTVIVDISSNTFITAFPSK